MRDAANNNNNIWLGGHDISLQIMPIYNLNVYIEQNNASNF